MSDTLDDIQDAQDEQEGARQEAQDQAAYAQPAQALPTSTSPPVRPGGPAPTIAPDAPMISLGSPDKLQPQGSSAAPSWGDYAKQTYASAVDAGAATLGAASWAARQMNADPGVVQHIDDARQAMTQHVESVINSMTPAGQQVVHASMFGGGTDDATGEHIPTPGEVGWGRYAAMNAVSFIPDAAIAILSGGWGEAPEAADAVLSIGTKIARFVADHGGPTAAFGTLQLGSSVNQLADGLNKLTPEQLAQNPVANHLLQQGMSPDAVKQTLFKQVATQLGAVEFALGAATGGAGTALLMKGPMLTAGKGLMTRLGLGAAEGATNMGVQAGGGNAAQQQASIQTGMQSGFDTGALARAVASGAVGGAVLGAGGAALHGGPGPAPNAPTETREAGASTSMVSPDVQQALDLTMAPPGQVPGSPQGEMFRTIEQANQPGQPSTPANPGIRSAPTTPPGEAPSPTAAQTSLDLTQPTVGDKLKAAQAARTSASTPDETPRQPNVPGEIPTAADQANTTVVAPEEAPHAETQPQDGGAPAAQAPPEPTPVDKAAAQAEEPTPAQAEAGNYQKGHADVGGLKVSIETPRGGTRSGVGPDGKPWSVTMPDHYGYIRRTMGADGDHVDVTLGPQAHEADQHEAFVIDQKDPATGKFDEHKAFLGYDSPMAAIKAYDASFSDGSGPARRGAITPMSFEDFKTWAREGDTTKALTYKMNKGAELRAKQKALMAAPGERMRGQVTTVEAENPVVALKTREPVSEERVQTTAERTPVATDTRPYEGNPTPEPSKIVDKLPYWLDRVREGQMTAQEAEAAYGAQPKDPGRPRQFRTFGDYIDERIRQAEDPAIQNKLKLDLIKEQKAEARGQAKGAETERLNRLLAETGKEAADKLRALKAELDPVGAAVEPKEMSSADKLRARKAERDAAKAAGKVLESKGWGEAGGGTDNYRGTINDPAINKPVDDLLADGKNHNAHDYLDAIANDPAVRAKAPGLAALATRLRSLVHADVTVHYGTIGENNAGEFNMLREPGTGQIGLDPHSRTSRTETLLHETIHAVTAHYIESLPKDHPDIKMLDAIRNELGRASLMSGDRTSLQSREVNYATSSNHELLTMMLSNPGVQAFAANTRPSSHFQATMRALGHPFEVARSAWAAFTAFVRRAMGLKGPASPGEATLLDHVLKPISDVTERAAQFNREGGVAPHPAEQLLGRKDFSDQIKEVTKHVDLSAMPDRAVAGLLQASPKDRIEEWNRKLFTDQDGNNSLTHLRDTDEKVAATDKDFHDKYADQVKDWTASLKGPERDDIARLIVDASLAEARLGKNADNSHLTTVAEKAELAKLQARYDALSSAGKASYDASHRLQDAMYKDMGEAHRDGMLDGIMPDATKPQLDAMRDAMSGKAKLDAFLKDPDNSDIASKFGNEWGNQRALVKSIAEFHSRGFVQGDYFPARRYGKYVLSYGEKGTESEGMEKFATPAQAEARRAELAAQGTDNLSQVMLERKNYLKNMISSPLVDEITSAMSKRGMDADHVDDMKELLSSIAMQHATQSAGARAKLRRQGIKGASYDVEKVASSDFLASSGRVGAVRYGNERARALREMQDHTNYLGRSGGDQRTAQLVTNEMQKRIPEGYDNDNLMSKIAHGASGFGYIQSLMSFSHMFTSTLEAHMNSTSLLGGRHGVGRASLALTKALKDVSPILATGARNTIKAVARGLKAADWNLSTVLRDRLIAGGADAAHMTKLFDSLNKAGLIDHTYVRELQRTAGMTSDVTRGWWGRFLDANQAGAHAVDVANKSAIAKAAFDLELRKSGDVNAAVQYATDMARKAMPNYNAANKARIGTAQGVFGALGVPMTQFKQYGISQLTMMASLLRASTQGADRAARMEARKAFALTLGTHALMAGALTLTGDVARWGGGAYDLLTGATQPHDYENDERRAIASVFGPELGEIISRGLPHAIGIDIHRRVGLANLLEPPELKSFSAAGVGEALVSALTGASGEDATTLAGGLMKILQDPSKNLFSGLKDMVPRIIRDPMKAYDLATQGATTAAGKTVLAADKLGPVSIIAQALGFIPASVEQAQEQKFAVLEAKTEAQQEHKSLTAAWLNAAPEDRGAVMQRIQTYNSSHPGEHITIQQLLQMKAQQRKGAQTAVNHPEQFGLTLPKKAARNLSQAGAF